MRDFRFNCPHCDQSLEASEEMMGTSFNCPTCQKQITLANPVAATGSSNVNDRRQNTPSCLASNTTPPIAWISTTITVCGICFFLFAIILVLYNAFTVAVHPDLYIASMFGTMLGQSVGIGLGAFLVNKYLLKTFRKKIAHTFSLYLLAGGVIFSARPLAEAITNRSITNSTREALDVLESVAGNSGQASTSPTKDPLANIMRQFAAEGSQAWTQYDAKLQELDMDSMFSPGSLKDRSINGANIARLETFRKYQETFFSKYRGLMGAYKAQVLAIRSRLTETDEFRRSSLRSFESSTQVIEQLSDCETKTLDDMIAMLRLVQTFRDQITFTDDTMQLPERLLTQYNDLLAEIVSLSSKEQELQQEQAARLQSLLEEGKKLSE